jgi:tripartite-type tricarboxylate transporter receptor subunit TctC
MIVRGLPVNSSAQIMTGFPNSALRGNSQHGQCNALVTAARGFAAALLVLSSAALAQTNYPVKAIHFITPFPPGGSLDPLTRMSAQKLSEKWGQPAVVENRPGANTIIGTNAVAKAAPDGYTILVAGTPHVVNSSLFPTPYDPIRDFAPIATIARSRQILVVNPALPVADLKALLALAKAKPGQLAYGSSGTGNTNHLAGELLCNLTGIKMLHIPYKGAGPATIDLISGQLQLSFHVTITVMPHIKSSRLKPIAITGKTRIAALPQVPVFAEAGLPEFDISGWTGMFAPAGTPRDVVEKISGEMARMLAAPDVVERLTSQGLEPLISSPDQFAALLKSDMAKFARLIKDANIRYEP